MKASEVLATASSIVTGDRNHQHGSPERSFEQIAGFWSQYLGIPVSPVDVCQMMVLLKIVRSKCGSPIDDHFIDAAGYSALAAEMVDNGKSS